MASAWLPTLVRSSLVPAALVLALGLLAGCDDGAAARAPRLLPVDAQRVTVNEPLQLTLSVENPDGLSLEWRVDDPGLPSFAEVTTLAGTPSGAEFQWTPLASHVGEHELVFRVDSSAGASEVAVIVRVSAAASAAPIFLRPGFGGTYDLQRNPCVGFDIEVRDDDSLEVELLVREPLPDGAELIPDFESTKRARFEWCPTPDQIERTLRWNIALAADDGDHEPPTPHDYLIVLRTPTRTNCPGTPPEIEVASPAEGELLAAAGGYPIEVTVRDADSGVRDQPILYFTTKSPDDEPDLDDFEQRLFVPLGGDRWRAVIPPFALAEDERRTVYYFVEATDNDDPMGTSCDQRSETPIRKFSAGFAAGLAEDCAPCTASSQCASGLCAALQGGTCLPTGACQNVTSLEGQSVQACPEACGTVTPGTCTNDAAEPNDTLDQARAVDAATSAINAMICPDDVDVWRLDAPTDSDQQLELVLDGFDPTTGDLDLALFDALDGRLLLVSGGTAPSEALSWCLPAGQSALAAVYGYNAADTSAYTLNVTRSAGNCCIDDDGEPDSVPAQARPLAADGSFEGTLCAPDEDWFRFEVDGPGTVEVLVVYDAADGMDLDLELYGPDGGFLVAAWNDDPSEESLVHAVSVAGTYRLRVVPYAAGSGSYLGAVTLGEPAECSSTLDCALFSVCSSGGQCVSDQCSGPGDCPSQHLCTPGGPGLAVGFCTLGCTSNAQCRDGEACKWFANGTRGCGQKGGALNGAACTFFEECGGQRDCFAWPGGYCARAGCTSNADCESDTFCMPGSGGQPNVCVKRCGAGHPECRLAEGYACRALSSVDGTSESGCTP